MKLKEQMTADGSTTYFNEEFQESYHSRHGAYTEALEKHVQACRISELAASTNELKILDFCFGLGYNSAVAIIEALKVNPEIQIEIIGLENDIEIIQEIAKIDFPAEMQVVMKDFAKLKDEMKIQSGNYSLELLLDDARTSIEKIEENYYDAIFFDPFSPKVCPWLWEQDLVATLVTKAKPGALISTYSSSRVAKDAFANAGCKLFEGPKCGRRDGGVLAQKTK
ncbi:MAG: hypothetical protein HOA17_09650 [Candidatus Melainabacteria bacterium]|nr:hypothetical protein [Candidatus Melainabacteria bacterium]